LLRTAKKNAVQSNPGIAEMSGRTTDWRRLMYAIAAVSGLLVFEPGARCS